MKAIAKALRHDRYKGHSAAISCITMANQFFPTTQMFLFDIALSRAHSLQSIFCRLNNDIAGTIISRQMACRDWL